MRISRNMMYMGIARTVSLRSTCYRLNVGAVLVRDNNVLSIGYNGAPSGKAHCSGNGCQYYTPAGCKVNHAEANAITRASSVAGADLYCTHSACGECVDIILQSDLAAFIYETEYRDRTPIDRLIRDSQIGVFRLQPSGYCINMRSGELVPSFPAF